MSKIDWKRTFRKNELFTSLTNDELDKILDPEASKEKSFAKDEEIIRHGKHGRGIYLVGDGAVAISTPGPHGREIELTTLESGEFFGEMSLLRQQPRTATVKAQEDCTVLRISAKKLQQLLQQRPDILAGIFVLLSERMRETADKVIAVSYHDLNDKVDLFSVKLDAELKAMNSTLVASQAVFEQTTTRANEVISSTERSWTRMTVIGSVATTVLTLMIAGFGWLGVKNYQDFKSTVKNSTSEVIASRDNYNEKVKTHLAELGAKATLVDGDIEKIKMVASDAKRFAAEVEKRQKVINSAAAYSAISILDKISGHSAEGEKLYIPILKQNLSLLLEEDKGSNVTVFFREFYKWVIAGAEVESGKYSRPQQAAVILGSLLDSIKDMPSRNKSLSYYFLLSNLALTGQNHKYYYRLSQLDRMLRAEKLQFILKEDIKIFNPEGFILAIDPKLFPGDEEAQVSDRIRAAWHKITGA